MSKYGHTFSSYAEEGGMVVVVSDDGVGFDVSGTSAERAHAGIGIANVRTRLATLCGGTLGIESGEGQTVATVRIPADTTARIPADAADTNTADTTSEGGRT